MRARGRYPYKLKRVAGQGGSFFVFRPIKQGYVLIMGLLSVGRRTKTRLAAVRAGDRRGRAFTTEKGNRSISLVAKLH